MANRSYLFATNSYNAPSDGYVATGMSEFAYNVHPLYQLMVSQNSLIVNSQIWDQPNVAIIGDLQKGKQLVLDFLKMVIDLEENFKTEEFDMFFADTDMFFNKRNEKYALLEGGEIYELEDGELQEINETYFNDAKKNGAEVIALLEKHNQGILTIEELNESSFYNDFIEVSTEDGEWEIEDVDWVDFWTTILYFDLGGEEDLDDEEE